MDLCELSAYFERSKSESCQICVFYIPQLHFIFNHWAFYPGLLCAKTKIRVQNDRFFKFIFFSNTYFCAYFFCFSGKQRGISKNFLTETNSNGFGRFEVSAWPKGGTIIIKNKSIYWTSQNTPFGRRDCVALLNWGGKHEYTDCFNCLILSTWRVKTQTQNKSYF